MNYEQALSKLASVYGIEEQYWDVQGNCQRASMPSKLAILKSLGVAAATEQEVEQSLETYVRDAWSEVVPPVAVFFSANLPARIALRGVPADTEVKWNLVLESGDSLSGCFHVGSLAVLESHELESRLLEKREFLIEQELPFGYHKLSLEIEDVKHECTLIVAPDQAFQLEQATNGISAQLYSLKTESNWGIGDLGDVAKQLKPLHAAGVDFIGLNPLHALFESDRDNVSPYSPCSRLSQSILIVDCTEIAEYQWISAPSASLLTRLRDEPLVNYAKVWELKLQVLALMFEEFCKRHLGNNTARAKEFKKYKKALSPRQHLQAVYSALREELLQEDDKNTGYPAWPEQFRSPNGKQVRPFAKKNKQKIDFYHYVQWQIDTQLSALSRSLKDEGFRVGLYMDLALGANSWGAEVWSEQNLFCLDLSMGAPPDELGPKGQDWGLPPYHPGVLRKTAYQAFIEVLQFNMLYAGALRIDHVMSLYRLYCIPRGMQASEGAYLRYPFQDLLAIVCLESQRNQCVVIGEDLGTVPDEVREGMSKRGILSYKVLYFERHGSGFKLPAEYPTQALVVASTHDLPTLKSYWRAKDITLRHSLSLYLNPEVVPRLYAERERHKQELLWALSSEGFDLGGDVLDLCGAELSPDLCKRLYQFLQRTPCRLRSVQVEDVLLEDYQVNVPGTVNEHPNWRAKYSAIFDGQLCERVRQYLIY